MLVILLLIFLYAVLLMFSLIVIFIICIKEYLLDTPFNLTYNPRKAHAFREKT